MIKNYKNGIFNKLYNDYYYMNQQIKNGYIDR